MLTPRPQLILFDADGTLYQSEHLNYEANRLAARDLHGYELTAEEFDIEVRRGNLLTYELLRLRGHQVDLEHFITHRHDHFKRLVVDELAEVPGLYDFLKWCEREGIRRSVVTSSRRATVTTCLTTLGIAGFFEDIVCNEDVAARRKPHPYPYELGLERARIDPADAIAIEDTAKGITAAKTAGLRCIGMRNETNTKDELSDADLLIDDYHDLLKKAG